MSHSSLYNVNGLMFWSEEEIRLRNMFVDHMKAAVQNCLFSMNPAFKMIQCEAPVITPRSAINKNYNNEDFYPLSSGELEPLVLRPETTMGSYSYARHILSGYHDPKFRLPICVWQHGKSFRREQDQPTKFMRLKEFYQLEFQILFASSTANDYYPVVVEAVKKALSELLNHMVQQTMHICYKTASDRLPDYSEETTDIVFGKDVLDCMEICSISRRKDYDEKVKNIEVAIGTDRCVYNFMKKRENSL